MRRFGRIFLLIVLAAGMFLAELGKRDFTTSFEARVAAPARVMAQSGWPWAAARVAVPQTRLVKSEGDLSLKACDDLPPLMVNAWLVPVFNGEMRLQKPPLPYWCAAVLFKVFSPSEGWARLTPALLGFLATFLLYDLARRLAGRRAAFFAALAWVSLYFVPSEYRKAMVDPYLGFFTLGCLWSWVRWTSAPRRFAWAALFYLLLALGLLSKGPLIMLHAAVPIVLYHICCRRRAPGTINSHLAGLAMALVIALPWPLYVLKHVPQAWDFWWFESVGELSENTRNTKPWYFYLPAIVQLSLPWIAVWVVGVAIPFVRRGARRRSFALLWVGIITIFFSFVLTKKNAYLLPVMPGMALLVGQGAAMLAAERRRGKRGLPDGIAVGQGLAGAVLAVVLGWLWLFSADREPLVVAIPLTLLALAAGLGGLLAARRWRFGNWLVLQAAVYAFLTFAFYNSYHAVKENRDSPRAFLDQVEQIVSQRPQARLSRQWLPETAVFYLPEELFAHPAASHVFFIIGQNPGVSYDAQFFGTVAAREKIVGVNRITGSPVNNWALYELTLAPQ